MKPKRKVKTEINNDDKELNIEEKSLESSS